MSFLDMSLSKGGTTGEIHWLCYDRKRM